MKTLQPVFDLHCDLLSFMASQKGASINSPDIGCSLPFLKAGNVKGQVLAIYSPVKSGSTDFALKQSQIFKNLLKDFEQELKPLLSREAFHEVLDSNKTGIIASIESAAGLCEEDQSLDQCFSNLEEIIKNTGRLIYISLTHHEENRFGGGNYTSTGLKDDGEVLLDYLHEKKIAIDLSHTSDALAYGILDHIDKKGLDIPVIASHSNFRPIFDHPRNLPDELVQEVINRNGLIGMNFLRAFLHPDDPEALYDHIKYGLKSEATDCLAFGADYFNVKQHPDKSRIPFYSKELENAGMFPSILKKIGSEMSEEFAAKI
ncbi:dipeptidase, partial [Xanthovirga aplysinae]|uniref:dipeptidase n=1 Tax=Xanthovirga aplysinae TaxID=2529853 RepID=UPI0012BC9F1F